MSMQLPDHGHPRGRVDMAAEEGFTLIELMIVSMIIAVLAAIAIPQFSDYRQRVYEAAAESDLANAALDMESYFADNGTYHADGLISFVGSDGVSVTLKSVGASFCLESTHSAWVDETWSWDHSAGGQQGRGSTC